MHLQVVYSDCANCFAGMLHRLVALPAQRYANVTRYGEERDES
jgi:hypothetical protein